MDDLVFRFVMEGIEEQERFMVERDGPLAEDLGRMIASVSRRRIEADETIINARILFHGWTVLHIAAWLNDLEILEKWLYSGYFTGNEETLHGNTPLHTAIHFGNEEAAKILVNFGVDMDKEDDLGKTARAYAASMGITPYLDVGG